MKNELNIIANEYSFTNQMMLDRCLLLKKVISKTKQVKEGRGKNVVVRNKLKYNIGSETIARINNSVSYYRKLVESEV